MFAFTELKVTEFQSLDKLLAGLPLTFRICLLNSKTISCSTVVFCCVFQSTLHQISIFSRFLVGLALTLNQITSITAWQAKLLILKACPIEDNWHANLFSRGLYMYVCPVNSARWLWSLLSPLYLHFIFKANSKLKHLIIRANLIGLREFELSGLQCISIFKLLSSIYNLRGVENFANI